MKRTPLNHAKAVKKYQEKRKATAAERAKLVAQKRREKAEQLKAEGKKPRRYSTTSTGKHSKTWWRNKASALAREYNRLTLDCCQAIGYDYKGKPIPCGGDLEWCHLVGRGERLVMHDPLNFTRMCVHHHYFFTNHPSAWTAFVESKWPGRWDRIDAVILEGGKPDYEYWCDFYTRKLQELKEAA